MTAAPILIRISPTHTSVTTSKGSTELPAQEGIRAAVSRALASCEVLAPAAPLSAEAVLQDDWCDLDDDLQLLGGLNLGGA